MRHDGDGSGAPLCQILLLSGVLASPRGGAMATVLGL
jgi:hypothetical protein